MLIVARLISGFDQAALFKIIKLNFFLSESTRTAECMHHTITEIGALLIVKML